MITLYFYHSCDLGQMCFNMVNRDQRLRYQSAVYVWLCKNFKKSMNYPAASCRVSIFRKQFELPERLSGLTLPRNILLHYFPVASLSNSSNIIPIRPKLSTPQLTLYLRLPPKYLSGCNTLEYLHNPARRYFRMSTA